MTFAETYVIMILADLTHNMDLSRIPAPTDADFARIEKYKKAYAILTDSGGPCCGTADKE